jgi:hypothetical protein
MKLCNRCKITKQDSDFRQRLDKRDGRKYLNNECIQCDKERARIYYDKKKNDPVFKQKNRERAKRYVNSNPEEIRNRRKLPAYIKKHAEFAKKRYHKVKDEINAKQKIKRQTPEYKEYVKKYREKNKEKIAKQEAVTKKRYHEKHKTSVSDEYAIQQLVSQGYGTRAEVEGNKELIEIKKVQILTKRLKVAIANKKKNP